MEKKKIVLRNQEELAYLDVGDKEKTLLLIHGNFSSSLHYMPLIERLEDYRILAPDLRGFGDSSYLNRITSLKELADDLIEFLDRLSVQKVVVVGWSLGGGVAMELAAHYPERCSELILINSTTHKGYPLFKKDEKGQALLGQVYASPDELGTDPVQVIPLLNAQKENNFAVMNYVFDLTIYTVKKPDPTWNEIWIKESLKQKNLMDADWGLATLNLSDQPNFYVPGQNTISLIKCPVLHTWGTKDIVVPEAMVLDNINALEKQSTYIIYEDCGHSPLVDVPDQLANDIKTFIAH